MEPEYYTGIVSIGNKVVILARIDDYDITGFDWMGLPINFHGTDTLKNQECLVVRVSVGSGFIVRAFPRLFENHSTLIECGTGENGSKNVTVSDVGQVGEAILLHGASGKSWRLNIGDGGRWPEGEFFRSATQCMGRDPSETGLEPPPRH